MSFFVKYECKKISYTSRGTLFTPLFFSSWLNLAAKKEKKKVLEQCFPKLETKQWRRGDPLSPSWKTIILVNVCVCVYSERWSVLFLCSFRSGGKGRSWRSLLFHPLALPHRFAKLRAQLPIILLYQRLCSSDANCNGISLRITIFS